MTALRSCSGCGADLLGDTLGGLCPRCQLRSDSAAFRVTAANVSTEAFPSPIEVPAPADLARHFPQLEVLELIGRGGMGVVYKARQPRLDRLAALKVLPPASGRDPAFAERFAREARALARLSHPNIVSVYDFGESDGLYYFLMEFVDGASLRQVLHSGRPRTQEALRVVTQVCEALQYAHEEGIIHRDIKPENILLDSKGRVKVVDFGLARVLSDSHTDSRLTHTHQAMGTLHYMAPEQLERPLAVDHRADLYSLGVVLYELLTGELPLGRFPLPSERAAVDPRLDDVVLRALEKEPARRYQDAGELKVDLHDIQEAPLPATAPCAAVAQPARAADTVPSTAIPIATPAPPASPLPNPPPPRGEGRVGGAWLAGVTTAAAVVLCFAGAAAIFLPWSATPGLTEESAVNGLHTWHGAVAAALFLVVGVALLAAGEPGRPSLWRALAMLGTGASIAVVTFLYVGWVAEPKPLPPAPDPTKPIQDFVGDLGKLAPEMGGGTHMVQEFLSIPGKIERELKQPGELRAGAYLALASAFGLLILGALRLRAWTVPQKLGKRSRL